MHSKKEQEEISQNRKIREEEERQAWISTLESLTPELQSQLTFTKTGSNIKIVNSAIAVMHGSRSEWGSSGGIGYYAQVRVFYGSQSELKEWQWRDRFDASWDNPRLIVHRIGAVKVLKQANKVAIEIELINDNYGSRTTVFTFDSSKITTNRALSIDEQTAFAVRVNDEKLRIMTEFYKLWECKPRDFPMPGIQETEIDLEVGVAAFVIEEQIDCRAGDPQIRRGLYVLTVGKDIEKKAEDHGYGREGGAFLTIVDVKPEYIIINTKKGKEKIDLN